MIKMLMPLETRFLNDSGGFWVDPGGKLASKIEQKSMLSSRGVFLNNHRFSMRKTMILKVPGSKLKGKINENSTKNEVIMGKRLGIDFVFDFGGFERPSWHQVGFKNR